MTEQLLNQVLSYIQDPRPIWKLGLAEVIVKEKTSELISSGRIGSDGVYHTAKMLDQNVGFQNYGFLPLDSRLPIELPNYNLLARIYTENALDVLSSQEMLGLDVAIKVNDAMKLLALAGDCDQCVSKLVKALQILRQPEPEFDVSYSHPNIPFTIFVSLGEDHSGVETLRFSESILHEAMHLLLSLIEGHVPLVGDNSQIFYSPWRETERPLRGVLHGMFVFRAVLDFYSKIGPELSDPIAKDFAEYRVKQITAELLQLDGFSMCKGLTADGANLAAGLWPSN